MGIGAREEAVWALLHAAACRYLTELVSRCLFYFDVYVCVCVFVFECERCCMRRRVVA